MLTAWGRILSGYTPSLSIEITRECPLHCPGCYAYGDDHLGGDLRLRELRDFKGQALIDGVLELVDRHRPLHLSIVGGEPLVRYRELDTLLPILAARGVYTQLDDMSKVPDTSALMSGTVNAQVMLSYTSDPAATTVDLVVSAGDESAKATYNPGSLTFGDALSPSVYNPPLAGGPSFLSGTSGKYVGGLLALAALILLAYGAVFAVLAGWAYIRDENKNFA